MSSQSLPLSTHSLSFSPSPSPSQSPFSLTPTSPSLPYLILAGCLAIVVVMAFKRGSVWWFLVATSLGLTVAGLIAETPASSALWTVVSVAWIFLGMGSPLLISWDVGRKQVRERDVEFLELLHRIVAIPLGVSSVLWLCAFGMQWVSVGIVWCAVGVCGKLIWNGWMAMVLKWWRMDRMNEDDE
eukprot:TRINITY_DN10880_c0_g1_i4.p1 TRINITY_DN10880_c0_g1~~TRINITY_DN10880_c0_g1_i4.p1  ORF type:complete len:185 (+),score=27.45 TRINITY_DN10880_c0_g1_i4:1371-1925(+)